MITISQQPSAYNLVVQPNVWTIAGLTTEDGYYIEVKDYLSATVIATIKQPANPAGVAHFDVSRILQAQMYSSFYETTPKVAPTPGETYNYYIYYGTYTDNITSYVGGSNTKVVLNGYDNWKNLNWNDTPFNPSPDHIACVGTGFNAEYPTEYSFLTNYPAPTYPIRSSTYHTLGFFNRLANWDSFDDWELNVQPAYVRIKFYTPDNALIQTAIYSISEDNGLGPKLTFASTGPIAGGGEFYTNEQIVGQLGAGPQNLKDAGYWPQSSFSTWNTISQQWGNYNVIWNDPALMAALVGRYEVEILSIDQCYFDANGAPEGSGALELEPYLGDVIYSFEFQVADPCSAFEPITVSFLNQYGVRDYFTFDKRNTYNVGTKRQEYYKSNKSWSSATYEINQHTGGSTTFSSAIQTDVTLSTDWMDDNVSVWLEELYTSPSVQLYIDGAWEPCVITSRGYEQKTYSRNKMFQHTLNVKYANNKRVQQG